MNESLKGEILRTTQKKLLDLTAAVTEAIRRIDAIVIGRNRDAEERFDKLWDVREALLKALPNSGFSATEVRTVDVLPEEQFLKTVLKIVDESEDLAKLGDHVMKLVHTVVTCTVRLAYDRKVAIVSSTNENDNNNKNETNNKENNQ